MVFPIASWIFLQLHQVHYKVRASNATNVITRATQNKRFKNIPKVSKSVPSKSVPEISRIEYLSCYHWDGNAERIVLELSTLAAELAIQIWMSK